MLDLLSDVIYTPDLSLFEQYKTLIRERCIGIMLKKKGKEWFYITLYILFFFNRSWHELFFFAWKD